MSGAPDQPYDLISAELRALALSEGDDIWRNRNRLMGLLLDHQPDLRREIRSVVAGVEQGVAAALSQTERSLAAIAIDRQASLMETEVGLRPEVARNVTWAIAHALDLGPLPSVFRTDLRTGAEGRAAPPLVQHDAGPSAWPHPSQPISHGAMSYTAPRGRFPWVPFAIVGAAIVIAGIILLIPLLRGGAANAPVLNPPAQGYAMEMADYGVPAQTSLREASLIGTRTPMSVPGGRRITTAELSAMLARDSSVELVDVLGNAHDRTITDAHYAPQAGLAGTFEDQAQGSLQTVLQRLTEGDRARPLVFFCYGESCWESYNAVLRASALGYTNLYWYRGGLAAWSQAGLAMGPLPAMER